MKATPKFFLLLPPSEGKAEGGESGTKAQWSPDSGQFGALLADARARVAAELKKLKGGDQALIGVKGDLLIRAQTANRTLVGSPTLPAWQRYTGVVWDHLDLAGLGAADRKAATQRIVIPSGLCGLVRADDPVPDYKLKIGAKLGTFGNLAKWWNPVLTDALASKVKSTLVIDLLPNEHKASITLSALPGLVRVDLVDKKGGVVGGHNAKAAKGLLAAHLLDVVSNGGDVTAAVASFKNAQYKAVIATGGK
jgi:hypothetical protein